MGHGTWHILVHNEQVNLQSPNPDIVCGEKTTFLLWNHFELFCKYKKMVRLF